MENVHQNGLDLKTHPIVGVSGAGAVKDDSGGVGVVGLQVLLKDVQPLIQTNLVGVPSGFTKLGHPILYFPNHNRNSSDGVPNKNHFPILESDLHLLFKYYLSVVPRTEQGTGFALIVDRRSCDWNSVRQIFQRVATLFPARIKEAYLLHQDAIRKKEAVNQLVSDFLLDFEIILLEDPSGLLLNIDVKCLPAELGGQVTGDVENWLVLQEHVEGFSFNARRIARRLAQFVGLLNQEDVNYRAVDSVKDVALKNRRNYRALRKELEDLTDHGLLMLKSLQRPEANIMQRLAVQVLCKQLDQAWTYFNRSWKMQDHVYVQYLELNTFQTRFREVANAFVDIERVIRELPVSGSSMEEVNAALDRVDSCAQTLAIQGTKARDLGKLGQELLSDHNFTADCVQPKCTELKMMCQKQDRLLQDKRQILHKFLDLMESLETVNKWCGTAMDHLNRVDLELEQEDAFSQIRQIDYLLSKSRELKLRTRSDFDELFEDIKPLMSAQTVFSVDDAIEHLESVTFRVMQRREELRSKAVRSDRKFSLSENDPNEAMKIRRDNILSELLMTESKYVSDLDEILNHYRDKLVVSNQPEARMKAQTIFGNLDELHDFHSICLFPELERCGANPAAVARAFLANCHDIKLLYSNYCQNMDAARQAILELGGEQNPNSILIHCQQEAGHQLPLSSYLLKPMQRLTKYQLLLKDLTDSSNVVCGKPELEEALSELMSVLKIVNDSMHDIAIKGLPNAVKPLGTLNCHEVFQVISDNKAQSQILFRNKNQRRQVFIYDNHVIFCKPLNDKSQTYQFKFSLGTASLGMSSVVKGEEKKIELWVHGRNEMYVLEAKSKKAKEDFAAELRKVIIRQKEQRSTHSGLTRLTAQPQVFYDTASTTASSESDKTPNNRLTRSRSLDARHHNPHWRSRSVDCAGDRSSPDECEVGHGGRYLALADYMALTSREIDLSEDEVVELIKVGCAGWWYVRLANYPYQEGWAPSTYLEKVPD